MSRYYGKIGFVKNIEVSPGICRPEVTEYMRYGDIINDSYHMSSSSGTTIGDYRIGDRVSVVANTEMFNDYAYATYVEYLGTKWSITSVDISNRPRMVFTLGGVYKGAN